MLYFISLYMYCSAYKRSICIKNNMGLYSSMGLCYLFFFEAITFQNLGDPCYIWDEF